MAFANVVFLFFSELFFLLPITFEQVAQCRRTYDHFTTQLSHPCSHPNKKCVGLDVMALLATELNYTVSQKLHPFTFVISLPDVIRYCYFCAEI